MTKKVKEAVQTKTCTAVLSAIGGALAVTNPEVAALLKAVSVFFF
ncbi:hypothetical protein PCIT_a3026 [Pseudoalteromonas citrea]|uniref:Uncharacterized protein n=1 Tax=Pseudoalteromonas citrea TaxID=43655 RepID=A0AAD4AI04_9GAMM|nr:MULTISPECIES: hypothetical protein [Pseudoalteromonas]KAF7770073.1 hypothetical protein PCIT_a3026 [Pseudoalteromonas citrea]